MEFIKARILVDREHFMVDVLEVDEVKFIRAGDAYVVSKLHEIDDSIFFASCFVARVNDRSDVDGNHIRLIGRKADIARKGCGFTDPQNVRINVLRLVGACSSEVVASNDETAVLVFVSPNSHVAGIDLKIRVGDLAFTICFQLLAENIQDAAFNRKGSV